MNPCERAADIAVLIEQIKVANNRIADLEKNHEILFEMNKNIAVLAEQVCTIASEQKTMKLEVEAIKAMPADEYAKIKLSIVMTVIGLVIGMLWQQVM